MKVSLANQVAKLKAELDAMQRSELLAGWVQVEETEDAALDRLVAAGTIIEDERDQVELARWMTEEEAASLVF